MPLGSGCKQATKAVQTSEQTATGRWHIRLTPIRVGITTFLRIYTSVGQTVALNVRRATPFSSVPLFGVAPFHLPGLSSLMVPSFQGVNERRPPPTNCLPKCETRCGQDWSKSESGILLTFDHIGAPYLILMTVSRWPSLRYLVNTLRLPLTRNSFEFLFVFFPNS